MQLIDFLAKDGALLVALIGLATALITLITALVRRRKVTVRRSEIVHETRTVECSAWERELQDQRAVTRGLAILLLISIIVVLVLLVAVPREQLDACWFWSIVWLSLLTTSLIGSEVRRDAVKCAGTSHPRCDHCHAVVSVDDAKCPSCQAKNRHGTGYAWVAVFVVCFFGYVWALDRFSARVGGRPILPDTSTKTQTKSK